MMSNRKKRLGSGEEVSGVAMDGGQNTRCEKKATAHDNIPRECSFIRAYSLDYRLPSPGEPAV